MLCSSARFVEGLDSSAGRESGGGGLGNEY